MTATPANTAARPPGCRADLDGFGDYAACERCGLAWRKDAVAPACDPLTVTRLRQVLLTEAAAQEGSHRLLLAMGTLPVDPADALRRAARLRGVLLFVDRCVSNRDVVAILQRVARAGDLRGEAPADDGEAVEDTAAETRE